MYDFFFPPESDIILQSKIAHFIDNANLDASRDSVPTLRQLSRGKSALLSTPREGRLDVLTHWAEDAVPKRQQLLVLRISTSSLRNPHLSSLPADALDPNLQKMGFHYINFQ